MYRRMDGTAVLLRPYGVCARARACVWCVSARMRRLIVPHRLFPDPASLFPIHHHYFRSIITISDLSSLFPIYHHYFEPRGAQSMLCMPIHSLYRLYTNY